MPPNRETTKLHQNASKRRSMVPFGCVGVLVVYGIFIFLFTERVEIKSALDVFNTGLYR